MVLKTSKTKEDHMQFRPLGAALGITGLIVFLTLISHPPGGASDDELKMIFRVACVLTIFGIFVQFLKGSVPNR